MTWLSPYRWLLYLALAASLLGGYELWAKHERDLGAEPYITAIAAQKAEAARVLAAETAKVEATQKQLTFALAVQEKTDDLNKQTVDSLGARLRRLTAATAGRLRDPAGCGGGSVSPKGQAGASTQDRAGDPAQASGLLSADLSRLLLDQAKAADEVNVAYASCRADAFTVRAAK